MKMLLTTLIFAISLNLMGMNNNEENIFDISLHAKNVQERLLAPIEISLKSQVVYIGESEVRQELEKIYGKEFPLNTIFFQINWILPRKKTGLEDGNLIPEFIPYESIKDKKEDESISLILGGKEFDVICKQHRKKNFRANFSFQELLTKLIVNFSYHADYFSEGMESLIKNKVIDPNNYNCHGENTSSFVIKIINK